MPCAASLLLPPAIHRHASEIINSPSRVLVCLSLRDLVILWPLARGHERDSKERPGVFLELPRQLVIDLLGSHLPPEGLLCPPERLLLQDQPTE